MKSESLSRLKLKLERGLRRMRENKILKGTMLRRVSRQKEKIRIG